MNTRKRLTLSLVIVFSSALLAVVSALRMVAPAVLDGLDTLGPGLAERVLPDAVCAAIGLAAGLSGVVIGLLSRRASSSPMLRSAAIVVTAVTIPLIPGGMIPVAGYTFAMVVIVGVVVLAALLVRRHLWWGLAAIAVLVGILTWAVVRLHGAELAGTFLASLVTILPGALLAAAHLILVVALIAWVLAGSGERRGVTASWVLRHRTPITIVAACCALPYTVARASWLTPWPLLAPSDVNLADLPMVLLTGLSLGAAMLAGGVLTLGLILPWGRRFPRWMGGLGGRAVPVPLAVVPASIVAALFTVGGADLVLSVLDGEIGDGSLAQILELALVFPFWLWGPLLGLAAWGYVMDRRDASVPDQFTRPETASSEPVVTRRS